MYSVFLLFLKSKLESKKKNYLFLISLAQKVGSKILYPKYVFGVQMNVTGLQ